MNKEEECTTEGAIPEDEDMQVSISENSSDFIYTVSGFSQEEEKILASSFFIQDAAVFKKTYKKSTFMFEHDVKSIQARYSRFLAREGTCEHAHGELDQALAWLCDRHALHNIDWWLCGSCALYLRGLAVRPHDIDIITYTHEIDKIRHVVERYIVEPFHHVTGWVVKGFGVIDVNYRIDYAFEPEEWVDAQGPVDFGLMAQNHLEEVTWKGRTIKIPPIEYHLFSNKARNRVNIVQMIEDYVQERNGK